MLDTTRVFRPGHDQGDVASLTADGVHYRCYVYLNRSSWRIDAVCKRVQEDGTESVVFTSIVEAASSTEITDTAGIPLDSPKIIAHDTTFVVHWLQATDDLGGEFTNVRNWMLYRATMDMTAFDASASGWTPQGAVGLLESHALYDACPVIGSTDYVVARYTGQMDDVETVEITVQRFDGPQWLDIVWTAEIDEPIAPRVLAVYAHEADDDVVVTYEGINNEIDPDHEHELWSSRVDAEDGGNVATAQTFVDFDFARWVQVGHCRTDTNLVLVVAEAVSETLNTGDDGASTDWIHHMCWREINSATAQRANAQERWCPHLHQMSRPWVYDNGTTAAGGSVDVYVLAGYKSIYQTNDWEQAYAWVFNLDRDRWSADNEGLGIRPRPILTVAAAGIPDARASGWHPEGAGIGGDVHIGGPSKRMNHISSVCGAPPSGPDVKTRTVAIGMWARITSVGINLDGDTGDSDDTEIRPDRGGIQGLHVYMEDPWTIYRDATDPTQPVDNFAGAYSRTMCQSCEIGGLTFFSGGTPVLYDGRQLVEAGFPYAPEIILLEGSAVGNLQVSTLYFYYAVFTWTDAAGQQWRSAPSRVVSYTTDVDEQRINIRVRTCSLSMKDNTEIYPLASDIQVEIYRTGTGAEATVFHRVHGSDHVQGYRLTDTPTNDLVSGVYGAYIDIADTMSDGNLALNALGPYQFEGGEATAALVATGAQVPSVVPAMTCCTTFLNRLWAASALDPAVLWYTDEAIPDYGAETFYEAPKFAGTQTFRIGDIGEITGMVASDEYLVVFTATDIYTVRAQDAGSGLLQCEATRRHAGIGCVEPRSIVLGVDGIYFQSAKGYYVMDRGGGLDYANVGGMIEDELREAGNIRAATLLEDRTQLRLACNGRPVTTYTTTWTINDVGGEVLGTWEIDFGVGDAIEFEAGGDDTENSVAVALDALIEARIGDEGDLRFLIASSTAVGSTLVVVWQPDVVPSYTDASSGGTIVGVDTSALATQPRVLIYDTLHKLWSRAELVQTSSTTRMSEVVDAYAWKGAGGVRHAVLTQGALLVERGSGEALEFADETSVGTVGVPIRIRTAWLHPAGLAGVTRVRRIGVTADKPDDTAMFADLYFDIDGNRDEPEQQTGIEWTSPAPPYGLICPRIQKCTNIQVEIYEASGVAATENVSITALVFLVGSKKGLRKVADAQIGVA